MTERVRFWMSPPSKGTEKYVVDWRKSKKRDAWYLSKLLNWNIYNIRFKSEIVSVNFVNVNWLFFLIPFDHLWSPGDWHQVFGSFQCPVTAASTSSMLFGNDGGIGNLPQRYNILGSWDHPHERKVWLASAKCKNYPVGTAGTVGLSQWDNCDWMRATDCQDLSRMHLFQL